MNKFNKSEIFKKAWGFVKTDKSTISAGLQKAWNIAKNPTEHINLQDLGLDLDSVRMFTPLNSKIVKETEKAICYLVGFNNEYYNRYSKEICLQTELREVWVPKSAVVKTLNNGSIILASWLAKKIAKPVFIAKFN